MELGHSGVRELADSEPNLVAVLVEHHIVVLEEDQAQDPLVAQLAVESLEFEAALAVFMDDVVLSRKQVLDTVE